MNNDFLANLVSFAEHFSCVYSRLVKTFPIGFRVEQIVYELQLTVAFVRFGCRLRLSTVADAMGAAMEWNGNRNRVPVRVRVGKLTCITRMGSPVSLASCSLIWRVGFGV